MSAPRTRFALSKPLLTDWDLTAAGFARDRAVHETAEAAGIKKRVSPHTLRQAAWHRVRILCV